MRDTVLDKIDKMVRLLVLIILLVVMIQAFQMNRKILEFQFLTLRGLVLITAQISDHNSWATGVYSGQIVPLLEWQKVVNNKLNIGEYKDSLNTHGFGNY